MKCLGKKALNLNDVYFSSKVLGRQFRRRLFVKTSAAQNPVFVSWKNVASFIR